MNQNPAAPAADTNVPPVNPAAPAASDMPARTPAPAPTDAPAADPNAPVAPTVDTGTDMGSENSGGMPQV